MAFPPKKKKTAKTDLPRGGKHTAKADANPKPGAKTSTKETGPPKGILLRPKEKKKKKAS